MDSPQHNIQIPKLELAALVRLIEATPFTEKVDAFLDPVTKRGLYLVLAENPLVGESVRDISGLLKLVYGGCVIFYCFGEGLVFLLDIVQDGSPPPPNNEKAFELLRAAIRRLIDLGIVYSVKKLLRLIIDNTEDLL